MQIIPFKEKACISNLSEAVLYQANLVLLRSSKTVLIDISFVVAVQPIKVVDKSHSPAYTPCFTVLLN